MSQAPRLPREFYAQPTLTVARQLLGQRIARLEPGGLRTAGLITETEAYIGIDDKGSHASIGRSPRNAPMWGPPGFAYVYFIYGMHWMFNIVTEEEGFPAAVLIRALLPEEGLEIMQSRRGDRPLQSLTDGPAKLCQALGIDRSFNGSDLCSPEATLFLERGLAIPDSAVTIGPRVGLNQVDEPWKSMPWRFRAHINR
ncbi:MAG TPA: DNA-3-methyladenine glycosylase [Chloroflexi bacterium]|nr:DNA-3-methyladenine glycosylase [Chloroflexota bacterium]